MPLNRVEYMRWAKALPPCRHRLCDSGVPDAGPDEFAIDGVRIALDIQNPYGLPALIETLAERYATPADRILPLAGTSFANFAALGCALARGEPVLLEQPGYEPLRRAAEFLDLQVIPVIRDPTRRFRFDLDEINDRLRGGARAVIMTDLHNPSGLCCPPDDFAALAGMTERQGAWLIVDEVYLEYTAVNCGRACRSAASLGDHVIVTNSLTKVYGLGRLRVGWMIAAPPVIERARDLLDQVSVVNSVPSEQLAVYAFGRLGHLESRTRRFYEQGCDAFTRWVQSRDDVETFGNDGAVFEFPRLMGASDTRPLCELLAREYDTLAVPGGFFGAPEHIRISFCRSPEAVAEGLTRLGTALDRLRRSP